jgi:hypothetical protein
MVVGRLVFVWRETLLCAGFGMAVSGAAGVPVDDLIQHPAHFFDLDHKAVTFRSGKTIRFIGSGPVDDGPD